MYCKKCGGAIIDGKKFCPHCGTEVLKDALNPASQSTLSALNTKSIVVFVLAGIMLLSMLLLPMIDLKSISKYDGTKWHEDYTHMVGEDIYPYKYANGDTEEVFTTSIFVILIACIASFLGTWIIGKLRYTCISAWINLIVLFVYRITIHNFFWHSGYSTTSPAIGFIFCAICSFGLLFIAIKENKRLKKAKENK